MFKRLVGVKAVAFDGASLRCTDKATGEVHTVTLESGPVDLSPYQPLLQHFDVEADGVFQYRSNSGRVMDVKSHMHNDTAADQHFQPSRERLQERQVQLLAARIIADERKANLKKQRQAARRLERQNARQINRAARETPAEEDQEIVEETSQTDADVAE